MYVARFKCFIGFQFCQRGGDGAILGGDGRGKVNQNGDKGGREGGGGTKSKAMFRLVGSGHPRGGVTNFCLIIEKKHSIKIKPLPRSFKLMTLIKKVQRV